MSDNCFNNSFQYFFNGVISNWHVMLPKVISNWHVMLPKVWNNISETTSVKATECQRDGGNEISRQAMEYQSELRLQWDVNYYY